MHKFECPLGSNKTQSRVWCPLERCDVQLNTEKIFPNLVISIHSNEMLGISTYSLAYRKKESVILKWRSYEPQHFIFLQKAKLESFVRFTGFNVGGNGLDGRVT